MSVRQKAVRTLTTVCASDLALFTVLRSLAQPLAAASFGSRFAAPGPCSTLKVFFGALPPSSGTGTSLALLPALSLGEPVQEAECGPHLQYQQLLSWPMCHQLPAPYQQGLATDGTGAMT